MSAISISLITSPNLDDSQLEEKKEVNDEAYFVAAKNKIATAPETWITKTHFVDNSSPYLSAWSGGNVMNAAANSFFHSFDKETAQSAASAFVFLGLFIDVLGAQSSFVNMALRTKLLQTFRTLVEAANSKETTNFELAEIVTQCANVLHQAEGTMGKVEAWAKVGTDGVASTHQIAQQINAWVRMSHFRSCGEKLSKFFKLEEDQITIKSIRSADDLTKFLSSKSPINPNDPEFLKAVQEQNDNFSSTDWSNVGSGVGFVTSIANIVRSVSEWRRITQANKAIDARIKNFDEGITALGDNAGVQLLTTVKTIDQHKKSANKAARVGQAMRFLNGLWGIVSKILLLVGIVVAPWIAPLIGAVVLLTYLGKGLVQTHYTRKAKRAENRLTNTFKILSKWGSKKYEQFLNSGLVQDLKKLVSHSKDLWNMLKAMKRLPLFADIMVKYEQASSAKDRLPILKRVLDIFRSSPPEIVEKQLKANGIATHQSFFDRISKATLVDESVSEAECPSQYAKADRLWYVEEAKETKGGEDIAPLVLNTQEEAIFQKFMDGTLEKAIASLSGKLPGWRRNAGDPAVVKPMATEAIKAFVGQTDATNEVLAVLEGLVENKKTLNKKWYDFLRPLVQSKTWSLTEHAQDCERALEAQSPTKLATTTLAAALTKSNAEAIALCRFQKGSAEHEALAERLKASNPSEISDLVNAIESSNGKQLGEMAKRLGKNFPDALKTALMLFGHPGDVAGAMVVTVMGSKEQATDICAEDWSNALAIMTRKQLNATFQDKDVLNRVEQHLGLENQSPPNSKERTLVIKPTSAEDPRLQIYIDAIVAGKIPFSEVPSWLLSPELSETLNHKAPKVNCADAFREDLNLYFLNEGKKGIPKSLQWPEFSRYGTTDTMVKFQLSHSFQTMLGIETDSADIDAIEMFKAAQMHTTWMKKEPLTSDIHKTLKKGGLQATVMLHRLTGLRNIPILQKGVDTKLFENATTQEQIFDICKQLINRLENDSKESNVNKQIDESIGMDLTAPEDIQVNVRTHRKPTTEDYENELSVIVEAEEIFEVDGILESKPGPGIEELKKLVQFNRIGASFDCLSLKPSIPLERNLKPVLEAEA